MKKFLFLAAFFSSIPFAFVHADEQPPFEVKDPAASENFRNIYLSVDKLSLLSTLISYTLNSSSNTLCFDAPTFCVDAINHQSLIGNGSVSVPSLAFANLPTFGLYKSGTTQFSIVGSTPIASFGTTAGIPYVDFPGPLTVSGGSLSVPALAFTDKPTLGFYRSGTTQFSIIESTPIASFGTTAGVPYVDIPGQLTVKPGSVSVPGIAFSADGDTGLYEIDGTNSNTVALTGGGTLLARFGGGNNQSSGNWIPTANNTYGLGVSLAKWTELWATNGTIQTSAYDQKRDVKEIVSDSKSKTVTLVDVSAPTSGVVSIASKVPDVPRAILFKWKDKAGRADDRDYMGFLADDLPLEAHPKKDDGSIDMESVYTTSVISVLCSAVRDLQRQVGILESDVETLKSKVK